jgi:aminoglycoside phosphotransferase
MTATAATDGVLCAAAKVAGLDATDARLIRDGSHVMYRLAGDVVARVGRSGTSETAVREVAMSHWLNDSGLPTTQAIDGIPQPVIIEDHPVTWWRLLPEHREATSAELGRVLRTLHALPIPISPQLPIHDPFLNMAERITQTSALDAADRRWLITRVQQLRETYDDLTFDEPHHVVHGDAWQGNVAVSSSGSPTLLDLEHISIGHADWDLIPLAVDHSDFARIDDADYASFVDAYGGHDVTGTPSFRVLAEIQELRWTCFVISKMTTDASAEDEARHRIACLRGDVARPWSWTAF